MNNKEKYKEICESGEYAIPLFLQYWWMETVCKGKQWDVALAYDGERIAAAMPYHYGRKFGMNYLLQPQLTQYSGPVYFYPAGLTQGKKLDFEKEAAVELLRQVESRRPVIFLQHFSPAVTNWLPFYWAGYRQTTRYTYRLEDIRDTEKVFENFKDENRQGKIRRCQKSTTLRFDMTPTQFAEFHHGYWASKGKKDLLSEELITRVCQTAIDRGNGVIASLHDEEGNLLAARFAVYDKECAHSLMSAINMRLHKSGHSETLIWGLINHLRTRTIAYDFEGSMDPGIEHFYRSFGTKQTPFSVIYKYRFPLLAKLIGLKNM